MSVKVTIVDKGMVDLVARLAELNGLAITIGFQGSSGRMTHPLATVPIAQIAAFNEFGTIDSPARPFLRTAILDNKDKIAKLFAIEYAKVVEGKATPVGASSVIGKAMAKMVRDRIEKANAWAEPNAPRTIKKKRHSRVLRGGDPAKGVAEGTMLEAVSWQVRRGSSVLAEGF